MKMRNIKLVTILSKENEDTSRFERQFESLSQLKKYIKECGGIKNFKWKDEKSQCVYFITGECDKCSECYYELRYGKYQWFDCNGYCLN